MRKEENKFHTWVICCVVVRILATGPQQTGKVSRSVGRECVNNGFMKRVSKLPQTLARRAFSFGFDPGVDEDPSCIELYCEI